MSTRAFGTFLLFDRPEEWSGSDRCGCAKRDGGCASCVGGGGGGDE
jgi:hypothetical protein